MALTLVRPWVLLLWPLLVLVLAWLAWRRRLDGRRAWLGLPIRVAMATLVLLAVAGPRRTTATAEAGRLVVLVDRSASVDPAALQQVQQAIAAAGLLPPDSAVVQFAEEPAIVAQPEAEWPAAPGAERATDLAAALDYAGQLLQGHQGSVLLVSDGAATGGDTLAAAGRLAEAGVPVDVWTTAAEALTADAAVEAVSLPRALWAGEPFSVTVHLFSLTTTPATLDVTRDGQPLTQIPLELAPGVSQVSLSVEADAEGLTAFEARVSTPGDGRPENDFGGAVGWVRPPPQVLLVTAPTPSGNMPASAARLRDALAAHGVPAQVAMPSQMPRTVEPLLPFQVIVLMDVSAESLGFEQMAAIEAFVYTHGRGLVVTGGPGSYSLGGYQNTALEQMLPVSLEPPERSERPPSTLLLIIDHSGSMEGQKMALAKEAAMRAVEILQPSDRIGVLAFNDLFEWRVPLATLGQGADLRGVLDSIGSIQATGGTDILSPLEVGVSELLRQPAGPKHIVLLSDGVSARGEPAEFQRVVQAGVNADITISTIAVGENSDRALMAAIAEWGEGRFHFASDPESVPRLVLAESQAVRSEAVQRGSVQAQILAPHPLVSNFAAEDFPPLEAYVALSRRPASEADVVLATPLEDPLLAAWQYGLGRVVAWTSDVGDVWTPAWEDWPELGRLWTQIVRYALPSPSQGALHAEVAAVGREAVVTVLAAGDDGRGINLATAELALAGPDGGMTRVPLAQNAPGEYTARFSVPAEGAYRALVTLDKDGQRWETPVGFVAGYAPEFNPRVPPGNATLQQIMALTGGAPVTDLAERLARPAPEGDEARDDLALWLLLAALVLWPVEIAIRRRWLPWR